jgi:CRISPR-associated protein Cas6/Cse3/CasE subtype I-E
MYITRIEVSTHEIKKFRLFSPYNYHQCLWHGYEHVQGIKNQPFIFRLFPYKNKIDALVYSEFEHNSTGIFENAETKSIDFPSSLNLSFDLLCNPTKKSNGKRMAILDEESLRSWLSNKMDNYGCQVTDFAYCGYNFIQTGKNNIKIPQVKIEGRFRYSDKEIFKNMLTDGLGHAKFAGNGMICVTK